MGEELISAKKYTNSVFYQIFLTGKYIKKSCEQFFKEFEGNLTGEEFGALDHIYKSQNSICQRDLALSMLINRANMGKILNGLEKKGYIKRILENKHNRPVKIVSLTESGEALYVKIITKLKPRFDNVASNITKEETNSIIQTMTRIRENIKEMIEIDI